MLKGGGALPLLAGNLGFSAPQAQTASTPSAAADVCRLFLFVHGNGDHAALWITTLWRMESNGVPRERMLAINFTDPLARNDDKVEQANRSSTEDQRRELGEAVKELKQPHRRVAHRAGRQFARRLFDPQLHQEWRRRRYQPRGAVRRSQPWHL